MASLRFKLSLLILLGATGFGFYWSMHQGEGSWDSLLSAWKGVELSPALVGTVLVLSIAIYFAEALRYFVFARAFGIRLSFRTALKTAIACFFFSWISPGAIFGAPAAAGMLMKEGNRWEDSLLISFGKSISSSLLLLIVSLGLITLGYLPENARGASAAFLFFFLVIYVGSLFTKVLRERVRILFRSGVKSLSFIFLSHFLYFSLLISILVVFAMALGAHGLGKTYAISSLFMTLLYMSPTPAGSGVAEVAANSYFGGSLDPGSALLVVLLFRSVTYYAQIIFGAVFLILIGGRDVFKELLNVKTTRNDSLKKDWAGLWFSILEEQGEFARIAFGKLRAGSSELEWTFLKHEEYDGVGGFAHLLRKEGYVISKLPQMRDQKSPGFFAGVRAYLRAHASSNRIRHMPWKKYDPKIPGGFSGVVWHQFTIEETQKLNSHSKKLGVSPNSLLFWGLDRSIQTLFTDPTFSRQWMIPTNLRGGISLTRETSTHSSFIGVSVPSNASLQKVHESIHHEIKTYSHWGNWWSIQTGRLLGVSGMRKVLGTYRSKGANWTGLFSNLGEWPPEGSIAPESESEKDSWVLGVTVTQGHPVGGGSLTWKGRTCISLTFHPSLGLKQPEFQAFMDSWVKEISSCVAL